MKTCAVCKFNYFFFVYGLNLVHEVCYSFGCLKIHRDFLFKLITVMRLINVSLYKRNTAKFSAIDTRVYI